MIGGPYVLYSEITGITPTEADIAGLLQPLDVRKVLFLLCRMNMHFRLASESEGITFERAFGKAQEFLFNSFTDEVLFEQIKNSLKQTRTHERPLFHSLQLLTAMRCAIKYCRGVDDSENVTDEQRYTVGRCCLMVNDLLTTEADNHKLFGGSEDGRKAELMTQLLPSFEAQNPGDTMHLLNRSLGMFRLLMSDDSTRSEILKRTGGYDLPQRFHDLTGVGLDRWIAILFCCVVHYSQYGGSDGAGQEYRYLWIDPRVWVGASGISENDLNTVLGIISKGIDELACVLEGPSAIKRSVDITPFEFHPLFKVGFLYLCSDCGLLVEKMFAGAYWAIHDREDDRGRDRLASAWGALFERYVNWWALGRSFHKAMTFHPFPTWDRGPSRNGKKHSGAGEEAFDAAILQGSRCMVLEYKGGFLALGAKHSMNVRLLLRELNKKIAKACRQLARSISELFGIVPGRKLQGVLAGHVTRVIPVIVVQDRALRSVGVNWWINRQFQRVMKRAVLRPDVTVEPATLIHIDEFETMIDSAEGPDFGLLETIQLRNFRDQEGLSDLSDLLLKCKGYRAQHSTRRKELEAEFNRCVLKYAFPNEYKNG
jgi:hypothetical protein